MKHLLTAMLVLECVGIARGADVVAQFRGHLTHVQDPAYGLTLGDSVFGWLRYDSDAPADPSGSEQSWYLNPFELTLKIVHDGSTAYSFTATGGHITVVSSSSAYYFVAWGSAGLGDDFLLGEPLEALALHLQNDHPVPGATTTLPLQLSLANFNPALSFIDVNVNDNTMISAAITSIEMVPEPDALTLAAIGAALLWVAGRRNRRPGRAALTSAVRRAA